MATRREIATTVSLVSANLERANLTNRIFRGVNFTAANMRAADLHKATFYDCTFVRTDLSRANLYQATFEDCQMMGADFSLSYMKAALFRNCKLAAALFRRTMAKNAFFVDCDMTLCEVAYAEFLGARFDGTSTDLMRNASKATYAWYSSPWGGPFSYDPMPGWTKMTESALGSFSFRENAARDQVEKDE